MCCHKTEGSWPLTWKKRLRNKWPKNILRRKPTTFGACVGMPWWINLCTSSSRGSRGRKFQKKKEIYSKETLQVQRPSLTRSFVEGLVLRGRQVPTQNRAFFTKACKSSPCPRSSHIGPAKKHHQSHQKPSKKLSRTTFKRTPVLRMRFFAVLNLPTKSFEWISFWIWC